MDDIEDLNVTPSTRDNNLKLNDKVLPTKLLKKTEKNRENIEINSEMIPGTQTVYMKTFGCSHNSSDSEYMAGLLVEYGYKVTDVWDQADAYLINSCTVKNPSEVTFVQLVKKAQNTNRPVIVSGCVPQGSPNDESWKGLSVIGVQQINRVVEVVEQALKGNQVSFLGRSKKNKPSLDLPKIRRNPFIEVIPINVGCLGECTYCKTKHARGHLGSYPIEEICNRVKSVLDEGVTEIRITSEDTGAYGIDLGTDIAELLKNMIPLIPDGAMLRVGMTNPPYIMNHLQAIADHLNQPNVYSFLHIPVQAGSNTVLDRMKREYTVEEFKKVCDFLIEKVPDMTIATDIICGFPGETEEDFEETMDLVRKYKFSILNISQFYPRPGTPAAKMKKVPTDVVKNRSRKITEFFNSYNPYDHLVGTEQRVWITETARDGTNLVGHTKGYVQVIIDPTEATMGSDVFCSIYESGKFFIKGKVLRKNTNNLKKPINKALVRKLKSPKTNNENSNDNDKNSDNDNNNNIDNNNSSVGTKEMNVDNLKIESNNQFCDSDDCCNSDDCGSGDSFSSHSLSHPHPIRGGSFEEDDYEREIKSNPVFSHEPVSSQGVVTSTKSSGGQSTQLYIFFFVLLLSIIVYLMFSNK
eukprot:TRINITY_DN2591_c0_g1_i1.p1 TRINITY_DN2591_c0_g1~~TRINITY_DN2591_c0_g1_i1.p1  ORF type:complete len:637 (+),score=189.52 TRINITY_DN2591_c0_g1_i1:48-1958(+)